MLSRVADNLYWMSRYLERAEHTARLLAVKLESLLEQSKEDAETSWRLVATALSNDAHVPSTMTDAYEITHAAAFEQAKFDAEKAALKSQLLQQRRDELVEGLIETLRQKHTIEINQPLVEGVNGQNG